MSVRDAAVWGEDRYGRSKIWDSRSALRAGTWKEAFMMATIVSVFGLTGSRSLCWCGLHDLEEFQRLSTRNDLKAKVNYLAIILAFLITEAWVKAVMNGSN